MRIVVGDRRRRPGVGIERVTALAEVEHTGQVRHHGARAEIVGRALSYAGIALGLGTAFFVLFVAPAGIDPRRESLLLGIAGTLIVSGSLALIVDQGPKLPPRLGALLGVRAFAGLVLGAVSVTPRLALMRPVGALAGGGVMTFGPSATFRPRRMIALAAGIAAGTTATLVSHATALGNLKDIALDFLHILSISVWTGGVVALLFLVLHGSSPVTAEDHAETDEGGHGVHGAGALGCEGGGGFRLCAAPMILREADVTCLPPCRRGLILRCCRAACGRDSGSIDGKVRNTHRLIVRIITFIRQNFARAAKRVIAWAQLNTVPDPSGDKPQYVVAAAKGGEGQPCDFTSIRVYTWGAARMQYETSFADNNVCGRLPLRVSQAPDGPEFRFNDQKNIEHAYRLIQTVVRRIAPPVAGRKAK